MATNPFDKVAALRDKIDATQRKEIQGFYKEWAKQLEERAKYYDRKYTSSAPVSARYYRELKKQIEEGGNLVASQTKSKILNNMLVVSDSMVKTNNEWLKSLGFTGGNLDASFSYVPTSVVNSLITGQVYGKPGSWSLSKAIWSANQNIQKQAYEIVAQGIATQMPIAEIAKSLSAFVDPSKRLEWNGPNGVKIYGKSVDYASQRLARTLVQHTYQQSFVKMTKDNPFIEEYVWIANGPRVCPVCADRDGAHFKKNKLPLDHPNGMCTIEPEITKDLEKKLADWVNAEDGTYPEIDKFAKQFGYKATSSSGVKNVATKTVTKAKQTVSKGVSKFDPSKALERDVNIKDYIDKVGYKGLSKEKKLLVNSDLEGFAAKLGVTPNEAKKIMDASLYDVFENAEYSLRINQKSLIQSLEDGRFKNMFEVGHSGGEFDYNHREKVEKLMFRVPKSGVDDADRPIYGLFLPKYDKASEEIREIYNYGPGSWYGDGVTVVFKKDKMWNQTTATIGDSLDNNSVVGATQISKGEYTGGANVNKRFKNEFYDIMAKDNFADNKNLTDLVNGLDNFSEYIEWQAHGEYSHSIENIEKIYLSGGGFKNTNEAKKTYKELIKVLENKQIPYEIVM